MSRDIAVAAKLIRDLDDLVRLLQGVPANKPWQRELAARLAEVDRLLQVLRLTISLEKPDLEVVTAAESVADACRRAAASLSGSRADRTTLQAVTLLKNLGNALRAAFNTLQ